MRTYVCNTAPLSIMACDKSDVLFDKRSSTRWQKRGQILCWVNICNYLFTLLLSKIKHMLWHTQSVSRVWAWCMKRELPDYNYWKCLNFWNVRNMCVHVFIWQTLSNAKFFNENLTFLCLHMITNYGFCTEFTRSTYLGRNTHAHQTN